MSRARHEGVTCDVCNVHNFAGKRYKCLICYDYDLCATCYDGGLASGNHTKDHAVQCILTKTDFDIHFAGENLSYQKSHTFTCPICASMGFTVSRLREHVITEHGRSHRDVICPVCATTPGYGTNTMIHALANHLGSHLGDQASAPGRSNSTEERIANIRRHLSPSQDYQAGSGTGGSGGNSSAGGPRRRTSCASSSNNGSTPSESRNGSDSLRAAWMPSASRPSSSAHSSSAAATSTPSSWASGRPDLDLDYGDYLSLHDSILQGAHSDRLRERLAAEARHADPSGPLYRYLSNPRFAGSGLRAAAAAASSSTAGAAGGSGQQQQQHQQQQQQLLVQQQQHRGSSVQFPSNSWECLMNTPAPTGEFILPGLLDDESLLNSSDSDLQAGTSEDRAGFGADLLLSLLDVRLEESLLEHIEGFSSDSEPEPSVETDV
ncbi:E3 ubiquitin-protein ligase KCMF1-like [Sycon ciliatum]|uniref:E3 ubiquitin-protein ligase KCMF1-like n=1 Tax=Sycon ciliatum TaxID=27933 RepID=UPI0031F66CFB|eukprot:scpid84549/ scgid28771/ E3 ubiquitin-protein ligase KCMF1